MSTIVAYSGLALSAFLAATLLPAQSEAVLAGLLATGSYDPWGLMIVAGIANTLGSVVNWGLGRYLARYRDRRWFPLSPERYRRACRWYERFGLWGLLFAWVPFVGDPLTVVAGALRVPFWTFTGLVFIGKTARYGAIVAGVAWIGPIS